MVSISLILIPAFLFLLVLSIIILYNWNKVGNLSKIVLSILLFFIGLIYIRRITSMPYLIDFSFDEVSLLAIGFIPILLASLMISKLLHSNINMKERNIFISIFLIIFILLLFSGGQSSLFSFINRIGQNGIVSDTEITIKADISNAITPEKTIEIADNYLRNPDEANNTYYWNIIDNHYKEATGTYIWDIYRDHWMKKVTVSTISWNYVNRSADVRWNVINKMYDNETLYEISFYFGSILHDEDNKLVVFIDRNGIVIGTSTYILK